MPEEPTVAELMDFAEHILKVSDPYAFVHPNPEYVIAEYQRREAR